MVCHRFDCWVNSGLPFVADLASIWLDQETHTKVYPQNLRITVAVAAGWYMGDGNIGGGQFGIAVVDLSDADRNRFLKSIAHSLQENFAVDTQNNLVCCSQQNAFGKPTERRADAALRVLTKFDAVLTPFQSSIAAVYFTRSPQFLKEFYCRDMTGVNSAYHKVHR